MKLTGENRSTRGKICPSAPLSTTDPTWTDPGSNPGLRGERPATNRLNHGTAYFTNLIFTLLHCSLTKELQYYRDTILYYISLTYKKLIYVLVCLPFSDIRYADSVFIIL
jgi:hypothetical protein